MIMRIAKWMGIIPILLISVLGLVWATSPDPKFNPATFGEKPVVPQIAPLEKAVTLAQYNDDSGETVTLLVLGNDGQQITGVDLSLWDAPRSQNPFTAIAAINSDKLQQPAIESATKTTIGIDQLLPIAPSGDRHIGSGTNFPEHAEEAGSDSVFQFPKFGKATPARTTVKHDDGILLDYEVEFCMRFDRDIASVEDFDAAQKGFFLCGDFTNRNALVELADPDNLDSGYGFSDSKSGPDSFPSGPFLVIPKDWQTFTQELRMTTDLNGEARQDAMGSEMTMNFRQLAEKALADTAERRFLYQDEFYFLAPDKRISQTSTLMSGTSEGVIFTPPTRGDYVSILFSYVAEGLLFSGDNFMDFAKAKFLDGEFQSGHFLKAGDVVRHGSNYLGDIEVTVVR